MIINKVRTVNWVVAGGEREHSGYSKSFLHGTRLNHS